MCGIVGYIGSKDAYPILIKGLKRLEYRGYDSAGVALIDSDNNLNVYKEKGKVSELEAYAGSRNIAGTVGIAHTRWATHGEPCQRNSHPHYSESEQLAIIHNGIIENYATIRQNLEEKGRTFKSDTDTEVLIQLIEYLKIQNNLDLLTAVQVALHQVIGAYAIAILDRESPNQIIAARKSSPLVVGVGEGEFFLGSDATPIVEYTDKVIYLNDGEIAHIRLDEELKIVDIDNIEVIPEIQKVELSLGEIEKSGYPHFMLKEIYEQPKRIGDCMRGRINMRQDKITMASIIDNKKQLDNATRFIIVACGTSWHAGLIGKQLIENFAEIPVDVEYASEFRYRNPVIKPTDVV
ncbi:MAG: glutamine--fructose-6-phosphate transaminase (isomerizing), partial [Rikenellaceae bacterium]